MSQTSTTQVFSNRNCNTTDIVLASIELPGFSDCVETGDGEV